MNFTTETVAIGTDNATSDATQRHRLGTRGFTRDGRSWRYCKAGAVDLVAGNCIQSAAILTTHLALTSAAEAAGAGGADDPITVTPGATAAAAAFYAEGYLNIDTTPGNGRVYAVGGHAAITASTAFSLFLENDDHITVALTTASRYGLFPNLYRDVIQMPITTATGTLCGIAQYVITTVQFGWLLTWGPGSVLINGTPALGSKVISPSATAAGAVDIAVAATLITGQEVGPMMQIGVSGKNNMVFVRIAP